MVTRLAVAFLLAATPLAAQQEERPKVPKDSLLVTVTGCLNRRVLKAADVRREDTASGPVIRHHAFRIAAKKAVMKAAQEDDAQRVEVTGLIRKSPLTPPALQFTSRRP